jgi:hypothetical protein
MFQEAQGETKMKEDLKPTQQEIEEANQKQNQRFSFIGSSRAGKSPLLMLQAMEETRRFELWFASLSPEQKLKFSVLESKGLQK